MGLSQGIAAIGLLLGGGGALASAVVGMANSTMSTDLGYSLATTGVIAIIVGAIMMKLQS